MKKWTVGIVMLVLAGTLQAATWDNGGDQATWESAANWNTDSVPGSSGDTEITASVGGSYTVSLSSDITQGSLSQVFDVWSGATVTIETNAVLGNFAATRIDYSSTASSDLIMNGGTWFQDDTAGGSIIIGKDARASVARFQFNGGSFTNLRTASAGQIAIGHTDCPNTAILEINGGSFKASSFVNFGGSETGDSRLLISGGTVVFSYLFQMDYDASDGFDALLQITGSDASITLGNNCRLHKNAANSTGSCTVRFILDGSGVSSINATANDGLYLGSAGERGALEVDVTAMSSDGTTGIVLIDYVGAIQGDGTFGSVTVTDGGTPMSPGTKGSLALGEYALDYADSTTGDGTAIVLYYNNTPPAGTVISIQ